LLVEWHCAFQIIEGLGLIEQLVDGITKFCVQWFGKVNFLAPIASAIDFLNFISPVAYPVALLAIGGSWPIVVRGL
jgi:hypothetical protein